MYTAEFKAEAIKVIEANQGNVFKTAKELGISMQTLSHWNNKAKVETLADTKQQFKSAEMEREFLKKAAAYFAKESQ